MLCSSLYTSQEVFARLLLVHCSQGKAATDFSWREYTDWHVSTCNPASRAFFSPDKDLQVVVADILENAAFEQATARNRWRRPSRSFAVAGHAWGSYPAGDVRLLACGNSEVELPEHFRAFYG